MEELLAFVQRNIREPRENTKVEQPMRQFFRFESCVWRFGG
ncbi:hypothetical protein [Defluviimonas salinarum]|nr:hypothetical protein [Defluviimonas salinarum]